MYKCDEVSRSENETARFFNEFFHSVYSPKIPYTLQDIRNEGSVLANFDVSRSKIRSTSIVPVYKKGDKQLVKNHRPVSLLNIDSKVFEKCLYDPLFLHFSFFLSRNQHGFVHGRSVQSYLLKLLKDIHEALDKNSSDTVVAFYTDFAKAFDRVPHHELLKKVSAIGVGVCFLDILCDYLERRTQHVRYGNTKSQQLESTNGVPQGFLVGPLLFCIFINDLPEALKFSDPYIFADDLKILAVAKTQEQIKSKLEAISNWVDTNGMSLAPDKCYKLEFRGINCQYKVGNISFEDTEEVKDLRIFVKKKISTGQHMLTER